MTIADIKYLLRKVRDMKQRVHHTPSITNDEFNDIFTELMIAEKQLNGDIGWNTSLPERMIKINQLIRRYL